MKHTYAIDVKVYERANMYELPFQVPEDVTDHDCCLKLGVHTIVASLTEEEFDQAMDWCFRHGAMLKVIGTEKID